MAISLLFVVVDFEFVDFEENLGCCLLGFVDLEVGY